MEKYRGMLKSLQNCAELCADSDLGIQDGVAKAALVIAGLIPLDLLVEER